MTIKICLAQINTTVGDIKNNTSKIISAIKKAEEKNAQLIIFPELSLSGYPPEDLLFKPKFISECSKAINVIASEIKNTAVLVGAPHQINNSLYNAGFLLRNSCIEKVYCKRYLPNYGVFDEKRYFESGSESIIFDVNNIRIGITICEDIWVEDSELEKELFLSKIDIAANLSASPFHTKKIFERIETIKRFAKRVNAVVCYTNLVGGQDELVFDGGSCVISEKGEAVAMAERFKEELLFVEIEEDSRFDTACLRGNDNSELPTDGRNKFRPYPNSQLHCVSAAARNDTKQNTIDGIEAIKDALVLGTRDYVQKNGFQKTYIGLSGGIDSAVTACIAAEAIGKECVTGISMPSIYTSNETKSDAQKLADNLKINFIEIPIANIFEDYLNELHHIFSNDNLGITAENLQARIRGNLLMALSNKTGGLVLTTGNKSEIAMGYCTLYGDTAGGFAVIKDIFKTTVYKLAELINENSGYDLIPQSIIDRAPTAELKFNQKDEDSLPSYSMLDPILKLYIEENKSSKEISVEFNYNDEFVNRILRTVDRNEYKRRQMPPGVKITPRAFGRDHRMPMTNLFRE